MWWIDNEDCVCLQKKTLQKVRKYDMTTEKQPLCYHGVKRYIIFVFIFYLKLNKNKYRVCFIITKDCKFNFNQVYWKAENSEIFHESDLFANLGNVCDLMEHFYLKSLLGRLIGNIFFLLQSHTSEHIISYQPISLGISLKKNPKLEWSLFAKSVLYHFCTDQSCNTYSRQLHSNKVTVSIKKKKKKT